MYHKIRIIQNKDKNKENKTKDKPIQSDDNTNSEIHNMLMAKISESVLSSYLIGFFYQNSIMFHSVLVAQAPNFLKNCATTFSSIGKLVKFLSLFELHKNTSSR